MIYVRRATAEDVPVMLRMTADFHAESPIHAPLPLNAGKVEDLINVALFDPDWLPAVVVDEDDLIGMALIYCLPQFFSDERVAGDFAFYVTPAKRGTRAGLLMLDYVIEWAKGRGARRIDIGINTGINHEAAARLFGARGLHPVGLVAGRTLP